MDIGVHSFAAIFPDSATGAPPSAADRMAGLLEEIEVADRVGLDFFASASITGQSSLIPRLRSFWRPLRCAPVGSGTGREAYEIGKVKEWLKRAWDGRSDLRSF